MSIDSVVYMCVTDAKLFTNGVENPIAGVENLCATTLRNIIGTMDLDTTLSGRDQINKNLEAELDAATDKWGIKINRVEVKTIQPPKDILDVMSKQMRAERERRQTVLEAEAFDIGNNMPINKKPKGAPTSESDPATKVDSSKVTKEVQATGAQQRGEVEENYANMEFKY